VGVEHADAPAIAAAVARARVAFGTDRQEFDAGTLARLRLANTFHTKQVDGARLRREVFGGALGVGLASGSVLVKQLNRYFTEEDVAAAMRVVEASGL